MMTSRKLFVFSLYELILICFCLATKQAFLSPAARQLRQMSAEIPGEPNNGFLDRQDNAESANEHSQNGRVLIKVYRGPDIHGEHDEHFAPFGYWVKQPADGERRYRR